MEKCVIGITRPTTCSFVFVHLKYHPFSMDKWYSPSLPIRLSTLFQVLCTFRLALFTVLMRSMILEEICIYRLVLILSNVLEHCFSIFLLLLSVSWKHLKYYLLFLSFEKVQVYVLRFFGKGAKVLSWGGSGLSICQWSHQVGLQFHWDFAVPYHTTSSTQISS